MIDKAAADHYTWGSGCDGWHLVQAESLSVIQELMPPHTAEVLHKHALSRQFFYVLSGEATIEVNGVRQFIRMHQGLEIAPGVPHQISNVSDAALHFLVVSCPPSHGDRSELTAG
jgi:mannose-6-phosphate isomerase-like protein (cupin superfamily)